jgi:hypothetical protein
MVEDVHPLVAMLEGRGQDRVGNGNGDLMVPRLRNFVVPAKLVFRR